MPYRLSLIALVILLCNAASGEAAKVKVWHHHGQASYDKAKFNRAVISSEGVLTLSRQLKLLAGPGVSNVWALAESTGGVLFAATGDEGKIFRIDADGWKEVYAAKDNQVLSLTAGEEGVVYAGTGPGGRVIRLSAKGDAQAVAEGLDSYVWSLAFDPQEKVLYAGTGPKGKVYRIDAKSRSSVFYTTRQEHILCLAMGPGGNLYAGTDKGGLVYRIAPDGKGFVVFHAHQTEVRSLLFGGETLFAGTSTPVARKGSMFIPPGKGGAEGIGPPGGGPPSGDNSLYRIAADGSAREVFRDKMMVLSLARLEGDTLLAGTGMQGQLFAINEKTKEKSEIARLDCSTIHAILRRKNGTIVLATGDPGKLYTLEAQYADKGTVLSDVLDAKMPTRWGAMTWKGITPTGTTLSIAVRSGNVADPDDTWSAWSAEQADSAGAKALAPVARYLQYRVTLATKDPHVAPSLDDFTLRYQTVNQAPEITSLDVPDLDAANLDNPKKLKIRWSASDPNDDELTFSLYFKKDGWKDWVLLEEGLERKDYDWDTTGVPAGMYQMKVVASDRKDNSPEDCLSATRISSAVPVAHVPPTVTLKLAGFDGERAVLEATATDPLVRLTEASFAVNGKKWASVFPTDGLFDSKTEHFRFMTDALKAGTHVVVLRVRDAAGNVGSGDVVFTKK
jgi:hypothetical protein